MRAGGGDRRAPASFFMFSTAMRSRGFELHSPSHLSRYVSLLGIPVVLQTRNAQHLSTEKRQSKSE